MLDEARDERGEGALGHEDHRGRLGIGERGHVQRAGQAAGDVVPGDELHPPRAEPPRQRDRRSGGRGRSGGDAGDDLEGDPGGTERDDLFLEPTEDRRVARLEPDDARAGRGMIDQQLRDMRLARGGAPGALADRNELGAGADMAEQRTRREIVEQHDIGRLQPRDGFERQQFGIARARADEGDEAAHCAGAIRWKKVPETRPRYDPDSATGLPSASTTCASAASGWSRIVE